MVRTGWGEGPATEPVPCVHYSAPGGLSGCLQVLPGCSFVAKQVHPLGPRSRCSADGGCGAGPHRGVAAATRASETDKVAEGVALAAGPSFFHDAVPCVDARGVRLPRRGALKSKR